MTELLEAKEKDVAEKERQVKAREARAIAGSAEKIGQLPPLGEARGRALAGKGETTSRGVRDLAQVPEGQRQENFDSKKPKGRANVLGVESSTIRTLNETSPQRVERDSANGLRSSIAPPQQGRVGAKQLEDAEPNTPKPTTVGREPEGLRTKATRGNALQPIVEEAKEEHDGGIPESSKVDPQQDGTGAPKLDEGKLNTPAPVTIGERDEPPGLKTSLQPPGSTDPRKSALKPIVIQRNFSFLDRL